MTEKDAKTKPCIGPRPEITGEAVAGDRPGVLVYPFYACRGSTCLAWRINTPASGNTPADGYCGLGGKP